jgi:hypothetical protein
MLITIGKLTKFQPSLLVLSKKRICLSDQRLLLVASTIATIETRTEGCKKTIDYEQQREYKKDVGDICYSTAANIWPWEFY